jgi:hypothetical protein
VSATVDVGGWLVGLQAWGERTIEATRAGAEEAVEVVADAIRDNLRRSYYPPSSPQGEPPAWRTGYLHDHVYTRVLANDTGAQGRAYPSTVYARLQELSGWAGRDHASFLPARPYVRPASEGTAPRVGQIFAEHWRRALPAG